MRGQANGGETVSSARTNQKTFMEEVIMTFSSPMAWLLVVALILTWAGVAIVLFDLLDYKTLAGLPPPPAMSKRGLRAKGKQDPLSRHECIMHVTFTSRHCMRCPSNQIEPCGGPCRCHGSGERRLVRNDLDFCRQFGSPR